MKYPFRFCLETDLPGISLTHANQYPAMQNDIMTQSWSSNYNTNGLAMTSISYDPNQYLYNNTNKLILNQTQQVPQDETLVRKVQFAHPIQQQMSAKKPLTNTQSWHETTPVTNTDLNNNGFAKQEAIPNRPSLHRSGATSKSTTILSNSSIEKPIYVDIDHRATLAGRGQTTAHRRPPKNNTKNASETTVTNKKRLHTNHAHHPRQKMNHESNESPPTKVQSSIQDKSGNSIRQLTTTSTSTIVPTKSVSNHDQSTSTESERKTARTRTNRSVQQTDQQPLSESEAKSTRTRTQLKQQQQQQQQQTTTNRNRSSPLNDRVRRVEIKQTDANFQPGQKQPTTTNLTRTRV
mgnify:FL=1